MTKGSPDLPMPVSRHGHANSSAANQDASLTATIGYLPADSLGKVGVIDGIGRVCA
jgi:hypothetical protein